jgi:hypothetical protein
MGKLNDVRTWILLAGGWGVSVSVGLIITSVQFEEKLFAYYAIIAGTFFGLLFVGAGHLAAARMRRRLFMIATILNVGICAFGLAGGFVLYGPPLVILAGLSLVTATLDSRKSASSGSAIQGPAQ